MLADEDDDDDAAVAPAATEAPGRATSQAAHLLNFSSFFAKHASHFHLPSSYFLNISPHPTAVSVAPLPTLIELSLDPVLGVPACLLPLVFVSLPVFISLCFVTTEDAFFADKGNTGCRLFMLGGEKANCGAPVPSPLGTMARVACPDADVSIDVGAENENSKSRGGLASEEVVEVAKAATAGSTGCGGAPNVTAAAGVDRDGTTVDAGFKTAPNEKPPAPMLADEDDDEDAAVAPAAAEAPGRATSQAAHLLNFSSFLAKHASHFHLPSSYFLNISPQPAVAAVVVSLLIDWREISPVEWAVSCSLPPALPPAEGIVVVVDGGGE
jgi:hypothetical protein